MFAFLLIVQSLVGIALIGVILMQQSEGGGLGVGGSSSGFMTARGAADFLTRSTSILGTMFVVLSIVMAAIAGATREPAKVDTSLANVATPVQQQNPASPVVPAQDANKSSDVPLPAIERRLRKFFRVAGLRSDPFRP